MIEALLVLTVANTIILLVIAIDSTVIVAKLRSTIENLDVLTVMQVEMLAVVLKAVKPKRVKLIRKTIKND